METESKILHNIIANQSIYLMIYVWTNEISLWAGLLRAMQHKLCLVVICSCFIFVWIIALTRKKLIVSYLIASHLVRAFLGSNSNKIMYKYWIHFCGNIIFFEQTKTYIKLISKLIACIWEYQNDSSYLSIQKAVQHGNHKPLWRVKVSMWWSGSHFKVLYSSKVW